MAKSIFKDTLILCIITLVCGVILGFVYDNTKGTIAEAAKRKTIDAAKVVMKEADDFEEIEVKCDQEKLFKDLELGKNGVTIEGIMKATKSNKEVGYVLTTVTHDGYGGDIKLSIGINDKGNVSGIEILEIGETAGLGMKAKEDPSFKKQYVNKDVESFKVTKTTKQTDDEIDALSGATVTSKAFTNAVNGSLYFYNHVLVGGNK